MIAQIKQIIEQISSQEAGQEKGISADLTNEIAQETGQSIVSGLKDSVSKGNISELTDLFGGSSSTLTSNPIVLGIISNLISSLTGKLGIEGGVAKNFAGSVIPKILASLVAKSKDGTSGFQLTDLLSLAGGDKNSDLLGKLGGILDLDKNKDGKIGLDDATSFLKGLF